METEIILTAAGSAAGGAATALSVLWRQLMKVQQRNDYLADTLVDLVERDIEAFTELKNAICKEKSRFPPLN